MEILFLNHIHGLAQTYWLMLFEFNVMDVHKLHQSFIGGKLPSQEIACYV